MKKKAEAEDSVLMDAAKTIGTAAGKIAAIERTFHARH